jgi:hypothetical protein
VVLELFFYIIVDDSKSVLKKKLGFCFNVLQFW